VYNCNYDDNELLMVGDVRHVIVTRAQM